MERKRSQIIKRESLWTKIGLLNNYIRSVLLTSLTSLSQR